jgi:hypothetical protein
MNLKLDTESINYVETFSVEQARKLSCYAGVPCSYVGEIVDLQQLQSPQTVHFTVLYICHNVMRQDRPPSGLG